MSSSSQIKFALGAAAVGTAVALLLAKKKKAEAAEKSSCGCCAAPAQKKGELIDGKMIAGIVRQEVKDYTAELVKDHGITPGLAVILVGSRKDSQSYVTNKKKMSTEVGFHNVDVNLPDTVSQEDLLKEVDKLNKDPKVHAILVQLPLPNHIDEPTVLEAIAVEKDVDGFSCQNIGNLCLKGGRPPMAIPCTPAGCIELLQRSEVEVSGKDAVVLGRSNIVGMPVAALLQSMNATVTVCHSRTKNLKERVQAADIVIAALGKAQMVKGDWLKPGCVVIDVGINAIDDATKKAGYRLVGDVDFPECVMVASKITPVPGGVGPMTIAMLLKNTINLARHSIGLERVALRKNASFNR
mmetsp:Transcript_147104/g.256716  ORF Transcript_147104/g.256716 Transcript_147104/m.256716 type:complete len:354 (-) Transcript_147104:173-1234(-)